MNILYVEDNDNDYTFVANEFKRQKNLRFLSRCEFDDIEKMMNIFKVDLIILDLSNGLDNDTEAGETAIKKVYTQFFLPIIIYSGFSEIFDNPFKENIFVKIVKKGPNGIVELKKSVNSFKPFIQKRTLVSEEIYADISEIYRRTYQKMISNTSIKNANKESEVFKRLMKRRLAASIDETSEKDKIYAWEVYLYPSIGNGYLTGDILRKKNTNKNEPSSYRIILSPSCDLQRKEPIKNIKVAFFRKINDYFEKNEIKTKILRNTSPDRFIFFHKLDGEFPHMICDLKELEVIDYDDLDKKYDRIVSVDSPFRESIVWADITINGRPGLPDRNCEAWLDGIKTECYP